MKRVTVTVLRISMEIVQLWTKTHWTNQNPYSDIEEEPTVPVDEDTGDAEPKNISGVNFDYIGGHVLLCHKRLYHTTRSRRASTCYSFYRNMCVDQTQPV